LKQTDDVGGHPPTSI